MSHEIEFHDFEALSDQELQALDPLAEWRRHIHKAVPRSRRGTTFYELFNRTLDCCEALDINPTASLGSAVVRMAQAGELTVTVSETSSAIIKRGPQWQRVSYED